MTICANGIVLFIGTTASYNHLGDEDGNMNSFRYQLANVLFPTRE